MILLLLAAVLLGGTGELYSIHTTVVPIQKNDALTTEDTSAVRCVYHGIIEPITHNQCTIQEESAQPFYSLVITPRIIMKLQNNQVIMERATDEGCRWFTLSRACENNKTHADTWVIEEVEKEKMPQRIPEDSSIVLLLPDHFIEGLENTQSSAKNSTLLPKVKIRPTITRQQFTLATELIALALIDARHVHRQGI